MVILPAIDILDGKAVRLYQGDYNTAERVALDPVLAAKEFEAAGAKYLHLVDLTGAKSGSPDGYETIKKIVDSVDMIIEVGGGIRTLDTIKMYLENGVHRVILGTAAINNKDLLIKAVELYGERIAVGIDARNGKVSVSGWTSDSDVDYIDMAKECEKLGVKNIIFTDISRDGAMKGTNLELYKHLSKSFNIDIIASGGVTDMSDIENLKEMDIYGAILGKAIYTGNINLKTAIGAVK
jgi:phosphoribosylformimino-5-aminoimidazole carboxamide ribotide isomerase